MTGPTTINTGVCEPWTSADAILGCCNATFDTNVDLDTAAELASDLLYEISGHRFPGLCETTVRPCGSGGSCFAAWVPPFHWPYQYFLGPWAYGSPYAWHASRDCHCGSLSKIRLAGYPVREILEVSIDGEILDPAEYELRTDRYLIRMADIDGNRQRWPSCQRMDIDEGVGTFFVHYRYGLAPPLAGSMAAAQLACQIAKACGGNEECEIPAGTVRVTRQGLTIDATQLGLWLIGTMRTGMPLVDAFVSVYAGQRRQRRTAFYSPENDPWPVRVG